MVAWLNALKVGERVSRRDGKKSLLGVEDPDSLVTGRRPGAKPVASPAVANSNPDSTTGFAGPEILLALESSEEVDLARRISTILWLSRFAEM